MGIFVSKLQVTKLGGGNSNIFGNFHPEILGKMNPILTCAYFSDGLEKNQQPAIIETNSSPLKIGAKLQKEIGIGNHHF